MKISYNWLSQYIDLTDQTPEAVGELLTGSGLEVEGIETTETLPGGLEGIVIGEVLTCTPHPNADRLKITTVNLGEETKQIVCGAENVAAGQKVVVATVGSTLYPSGGEAFKIKKSKIRGELSEGMICAEDEIGIGNSHAGIMVLDTELPNGTPAKQYFNSEDATTLEIGLTPNRADAASHIGVARDLCALLSRDLNWPDVSAFSAGTNSTESIKVKVENTEACPRYSGITLTNVSVKPSPDWLQERLLSIGLQPINNVVDVTNFVLHEIGQPLHAFDAEKITNGEIVVGTLKEGTPFTTLDEKERKLSGQDLMIGDSAGNGLCIAGVFGGIGSGVTETTTQVFLESAYFSPDWIRATAQRHGLKTDASFRYERGTDPNITLYALKRAVLLLQEVAGAKVASGLIDMYPNPIEAFRVPCSWSGITTLLGYEVPEERRREILGQLDIEITEEAGDKFVAVVPPYRVDVQRQADIAEEILRIWGYNNVPLPDHMGSRFLAHFPKTDPDRRKQEASAVLSGLGFQEIMTNSLTNPLYAQKADFLKQEHQVEILNKLSEDLGVMRQTMLFGGLEVINHNLNHRQKDLKLFEFGKTYHKYKTGYNEQPWLSIWLTGNVQAEHYRSPAKVSQFEDLRDTLEVLLLRFGINTYKSQTITDGAFAYALEIVYTGDKIRSKSPLVKMGKVQPKLAKLCGLKQEVFWAEVNWSLLLQISGSRQISYEPVSRFPEVRRDLSLVVDKTVSFAEIEALTRKLENRLIRRIGVFDVYEGDKVEKGKKAYAISFIMQDAERTLTDKVIDKTMQRLMQGFELELDAVIRK
jgi:phenylalanyl-tRNA synthetase beta chain